MAKTDVNLPEKSGTIVVPSFVDFLQAIIAKQKLELQRIQEMDVKAAANGNGTS
jgi:hypothetical protein